MAKTPEPQEAPVSNMLSLDEFCMRQSEKDRRVELIGAFESVERAAGRVRDDLAAYAQRYEAFLNQPA